MYLCNHLSVESLGFLFSCSANSFSFASTQFLISSFDGFQNHIAFITLQGQLEPFICNFQVHVLVLLISRSRQWNLLLDAWVKLEFNCYFVATKPLGHRPFRQQVVEHLVVSPELTMGGADSNVHTTRDGGPDNVLNLQHNRHPN